MKRKLKKKVNRVYSRQINPMDPFERLRVLMEWATQTLANETTKIKTT